MIRKQGYRRLTPYSRPDAVVWWYVREFDGFVYARGGRCRKAREARRLIDSQHRTSEAEYQAFLERPVFHLLPSGDLRPIDYGYG